MSDKLKYMKGEEFLRWLLSGERDFSGIELEEGFDLCGHEGFAELQRHLRESDLESEPVNLRGARLRRLDADGIYLPFLKAEGAVFKHAALMKANLENACLKGSDLRYARLALARMDGADLREADLRLADLNLARLRRGRLAGADLEAADLEYANLEGAELEGVRNLQWARFLKTVNFQFARIGEEEKKIIREALWMEESRKRRLFGGSG